MFGLSRCVSTAVVLALWFTGASWGNQPTGALAGVVVDGQGATVSGASVTIKSTAIAQPRQSVTDSDGRFTVEGLPLAEYELTVSKTGFRVLLERGVPVDGEDGAPLNLRLEVGPASETVEVDARTSDLEPSPGAVEQIVSFLELAEFNRNVDDVTTLGYFGPGVARRAAGGLGSGFVVGGARADSTNFLLDGFSDHDPRTGGTVVTPNWDSIEEFRIQATGEAAEYGRMAGGVMTAVLRTGGNRLHGYFFDYYRSSALGARNFFDTQKPDQGRNRPGATLTGPVNIPRLYRGRDRTFFLVSWEGFYQSQGDTRLSEVPTAPERTGNFSNSVLDPLAGTPFPGNQIPRSRFDGIANQLAAYYPLPNRTDPATDSQTYAIARTRYQSVVGKLDERINSRNSMSLRYLARVNSGRNPYSGGDLGLFGGRTASTPQLGGVYDTHVFHPSLVSEFHAGFTRFAERDASQYSGQDINGRLGLPNGSADPRLFGFPRFTILNLAALGDATNLPLTVTVNTFDIGESMSWIKGRHSFKFGADALRTQFFQQLYNNSRGSYNFLGRWTGDPWGDFLLGLPDSTSLQASAGAAYLFTTDIGGFVQDECKISSRLSLSFGVRYELMRPPYEKYGRFSNFVPELNQFAIADGASVPGLDSRVAAAGLTGRVTTAAQAHLPDSLVFANHRDFAPRFGFAFHPFQNGDTVLRGGYGIYYANSLLDPVRNDLTNIYPFTVSQTFNRVAANPAALTLENPFPGALATLPGVTNVNGFSTHPGAQYVESYTFSADRSLGAGTTLELDYIGSRGTHLGQRYDLNQPFRSAADKGNFPRPYAGFGTINYYAFGANSVYNGATAMVRRRFQGGLYFVLTYTYAKSIDDASQVSGNSQGDYPGAQNSRDLAAERGRSDWDTGHSLTLYSAYQLPWRTNRLTRGWTVSLDTRLYTGQPFTPRVANANLTLGEANRPDRIGSGRLADPTVSQWFDIAAFPVTPAGAFRFGNSGRNIVDGPGSIAINPAVARSFHLTDRVATQFRCDASNVINHANPGLPVDYVDTKNAGQILSADAGRTIQLGLRLQF